MLEQLRRHWWTLALRGVLAVLFGVIAFARPGITLIALLALFGAYMLVDGIFTIIAAVRFAHENERWWVLLLEGLAGVIVGVLTFARPGATALALIYLIAAWAVLTGILEIVAAVRLRKVIAGEWLLGLTGAASVLLGVLLAAVPGAGLLAWVWMLGAYALVFGVLLLALAWRLRGLSPGPETRTSPSG